jgi:hypothetical protein
MRSTLRAFVRPGLAICLALVCATNTARAEELGEKGNLVFAAERLFGFYVDDEKASGARDGRDQTVVGIGWQGSPSSTLTTPRLGIDYFLTRSFTLGGSLGIFSHNSDLGATSVTSTGVLIAARAGYAIRFSHAVSFWPRLGLSYASVSVAGNSDGTHVLALSIDAPFMFAPSENFAITVGPIIDLALFSEEEGSDTSEVMFGLMIGLAGWIGL